MKNKLSVSVFIIVMILCFIGIVMIYSASSYSAGLKGDEFFYVKKQLIGLVAGLVCLVGCVIIKIETVYKLRYVILGISYVLLILCLIPGIGIESYGAKRWLNLGVITLQPSEIAKFALCIYCAAYMSKRKMSGIISMIPPLIAGGITCVLLMLEPNMSITICVASVLMIMLFVGGGKKKTFVVFGALGVTLAVLLIVSAPYRMERILAFVDPWSSPKDEGYQLIQSYYALGSGGLFGVGLFNSRQKYLFLPFAESDFIFSVIGEELGFVGAILILLLYGALIFCGIIIALRAKSAFETLLSIGIVSVIAIQTLLNVAVVTGSIPPTGLPLPFMSAGGSSLMVFMAASGLLINISNGDRNASKIGNGKIFVKRKVIYG